MATAFAPINIALVKYWGKRDSVLNLPVTDSLSLSARKTGTTTTLEFSEGPDHTLFLNDQIVPKATPFYERLNAFLAKHCPGYFFRIHTQSDIPVGAGLASSASGYASLTLALNELMEWNLPLSSLSCLAREGSGSACRSLWPGLVHWKKGIRPDGLDSHAEPLPSWPELRLAVLLCSEMEKKTSSRDGMLHCQSSSPLYKTWPRTVAQDIEDALAAIHSQDFEKLGEVTERSSEAMHACMRASRPPLDYSLPKTHELLHHVKTLRQTGLPVYATQDAGPNVKLLYLESDEAKIFNAFCAEKIRLC